MAAFAATLIACTLALSGSSVAHANAGDLDPSFGTGGIGATALGATSSTTNDMALGADGRIYLSGVSKTMPWAMALAAFTSGGALDTSFNQGHGYIGTVTGDDETDSGLLGVLPDQSVVLAGQSESSGIAGAAIARFLPSGSQDSSFGGTGIDYAFPSFGLLPRKVLIQPGGKIVVVAQGQSADSYLWVGRWTEGGAVDTTFGGGTGSVTWAPPMLSTTWKTAAEAPDGSIYAVGQHYDGINKVSFITAKITANGAIDSSFGGGNGYVLDPLDSGDSGLTQAAVQPDGKLVSAGPSNDPAIGGRDALTVERHDADGSLDPSFGSGGVVVLPLSTTYESWPEGLALMPDGRIVLLGEYQTSTTDPARYALVRLLANGSVDPSLGSGGIKPISSPDGSVDLRSLALQPDGKIVLGGDGPLPAPSTLNGFYVVRLLGDPPTTPTTKAKLIPTARISSPKQSKLSARRLTRFAGSAGPKGQVRRVEIALQRVDSKLLKRRNRCLWLANSRARFKSARAARHRCKPIRWLRTKGGSHWSYRLRRHLKRGKYTLFVRVTLKDGTRGSRFSKQTGTLRTFRLH